MSLRSRQGDKRKPREKEMDGPKVTFTLERTENGLEVIPRVAAPS